ncbi:hypothetical protein [Arenimonas caeni]|jgi:hypothetical protein|uniref:Uncharacterized protein n=1 Tax=Arenimonas caeni TaxID=2058085 RepID=A0A2P6MAS7_9GAMM|nr:hypothetical protein [Arenimonas caeni]MDY0022324.1 hypothetical protein [Arenimonas caeni]PRH83075.1 hypothetical protein C6N40_05400 [Arenimonas caeni]
MNDEALRFRLRQLPREIEPARDLWPGIAARLPVRRPKPRRWPTLLTLAACLCLAVGVAAWLRPQAAPGPGLEARLVQAEVEALTREYEAALAELAVVPVPEPLAPALATLDQSAGQIREALAEQPGSTRLLDQLKRTYSRRLALTQRAALG